jgi:hypothetical protein
VIAPTTIFDADLQCELNGRRVSVQTVGRTIIVEVPDVATGLKLAKLGPSRGSYRRSAHELKNMLDAAAFRVEVRLCGKPIVLIGENCGSSFWKLFGLPKLRLKPITFASNYLREQRR